MCARGRGLGGLARSILLAYVSVANSHTGSLTYRDGDTFTTMSPHFSSAIISFKHLFPFLNFTALFFFFWILGCFGGTSPLALPFAFYRTNSQREDRNGDSQEEHWGWGLGWKV